MWEWPLESATADLWFAGELLPVGQERDVSEGGEQRRRALPLAGFTKNLGVGGAGGVCGPAWCVPGRDQFELRRCVISARSSDLKMPCWRSSSNASVSFC